MNPHPRDLHKAGFQLSATSANSFGQGEKGKPSPPPCFQPYCLQGRSQAIPGQHERGEAQLSGSVVKQIVHTWSHLARLAWICLSCSKPCAVL